MYSKNADFLRQSLIERCRNMTPEERVRLFIEHSLLMRKVRDAGVLRRDELLKEKRTKSS
jgi:hypothetical protein